LHVAAAGAAYGYLMKATKVADTLPKVDAIGRDATNAIALHLLAKYMKSKWLDYAATAVAGKVGCDLGEAKFNMEEFAAMSGGDAGELLGAYGDEDE
jgi:hypothetical protein